MNNLRVYELAFKSGFTIHQTHDRFDIKIKKTANNRT